MAGPIKALVLGGGGRETALAWKLAQSSIVRTVYVLPGNPGVEDFAVRVEADEVNPHDVAAIVAFAKHYDIWLTVVGPEGLLALGVVDAFRAAGLRIIGPTQDQAALELSKVYCKELLWHHGIPTADGNICSSVEEAEAAIDRRPLPTVVKPDGCTEGKGVKICRTHAEAKAHVRAIMVDHIYQPTGDTGKQVIIEEHLVGREASVTVLMDGRSYVEFATSEDHKQRFNGDRGPMTGGMGAYSPSPMADAQAEVTRHYIIEPLIAACPDFLGILYIALMITKDGPKVLEINVRFGDPETQVILPRLQSDLGVIFWNAAYGNLHCVTARNLEWDPCPCVCVVSVSGCYPEPGYPKGEIITGIEEARALDGVTVFQAATKYGSNRCLVTNGGRVVGVSALAEAMPAAIALAYEGTHQIQFASQSYRTDIGRRRAV